MASTTDVAGRRRVGMFEEVHDDQGNTFKQTSGRGNIAQYETQTGKPFVSNTAAGPDGLRWRAEEAGALPPSDMFPMHTPRTTL